MKIPEKRESETLSNSNELIKRSSDENTTTKFKFITNHCTSTKKNICVNSQEGQTLPKGSSCVVVNGNFKGLYLATSSISSSSSTINCMKYNDAALYEYVKDTNEFAGEPISKSIIKVDENRINPFKHNIIDPDNKENYDEGYFVIDGDKKLLTSTNAIPATAYQCNIEYEEDENGEIIRDSGSYECNPIPKSNKYYYDNSQILYNNGNKWYVETKFGYYFYNKQHLGATFSTIDNEIVTDEIVGGMNITNHSVYINSMVTDKVIVVNYNENYSFDDNLQYCVVHNDGTCNSKTEDVELTEGKSCYNEATNKLYIVIKSETDDEKKNVLFQCYTGSENELIYYHYDNYLYRMDGLSIQNMKQGYYILNEKWKEFNSNYPEAPFKIIKCENYHCETINNVEFSLNSDVIINKSGTGNNKLLKLIKEGKTMKFINAYQPGYYLLNSHGEVKLDEENPLYTQIFEIDEDGQLHHLNNDLLMKDDTIYINYAKIGKFTKNAKEFKHKLLSYDQEKDIVIFDETFNIDDNDSTFKFLEDKTLLYRLKSKKLVPVEKGLYAIKNGVPFTETEWTMHKNGKEICYYDGRQCDQHELNYFSSHNYMLNQANDHISIIQYNNEKDEWRVMKEDRLYFFFEDGYSITKSDRRISRVIQISDGIEIDVTYSRNILGYFIYDNLMIEGNGYGWEDAESFVNNVDVVLRNQCNSYEKNHIIDSNGFYYHQNLGICIIKKDIKNDTEDANNCLFSSDNIIKYYYKNEQLYSFNDHMNHRINKSGIYINPKHRMTVEMKEDFTPTDVKKINVN